MSYQKKDSNQDIPWRNLTSDAEIHIHQIQTLDVLEWVGTFDAPLGASSAAGMRNKFRNVQTQLYSDLDHRLILRLAAEMYPLSSSLTVQRRGTGV